MLLDNNRDTVKVNSFTQEHNTITWLKASNPDLFTQGSVH